MRTSPAPRSFARPAAWLGSAGLFAASALHVGWGAGASWPVADRRDLARLVAGTDTPPGPRASFAVAAALGCAAIISARNDLRIVRAGVGLALVGRGVAGMAGRTRWLVPWTPAPRFVELDRRLYGPVSAGLGALVLAGLGTRPER